MVTLTEKQRLKRLSRGPKNIHILLVGRDMEKAFEDLDECLEQVGVYREKFPDKTITSYSVKFYPKKTQTGGLPW